jgi:phosphoserine phosphatase
MYVLSLISNPEVSALTDAVVASLAGDFNVPASGVTWLAKGIACDLAIDVQDWAGADRLQADMRKRLQDAGIDVNAVAIEGRRKQLLIADMDSTMIHQECIDELGIAAGAGEHIMEVTRRAMRGELDFVEALRERVCFMKGLQEAVIETVINDKITFVPGGRTTVSTMKATGAYCALISGGFVQFTEYVAEHCGFHTHQANRLIIEDGILAGKVAEPALGSAAKVEALGRLTSQLGISTGDALTVGDGANDVAMLQAAGMGVAMHAKPAVRAAARTIIDHADLTALLYLQGYRADEFVT